MKRLNLESVLAGLLIVIFAGIIIHTPLTVWLSTIAPGAAPVMKSWKEILMVLAIIPMAVLVSRHKMWRPLLKDWVLRIATIYAFLHLVMLPIFWKDIAPAAAGLAIDLRFVLFFVLVYVYLKCVPAFRKTALKVAIIGAAVIVGFAALQFFLPRDILESIGYSKYTILPYLKVDQNPMFIRVNSTLRGPNSLGAYAVIALAGLAAALVYAKLHLRSKKVLVGTVLFGICSVVALWISYSRSALIAGVVAVAIVLLATVARRLSRRVWIIMVTVIFALIGGFFLIKDTSFYSNIFLHKNPGSGSLVTSNDGHAQSLDDGTDRLLRQPFGAGIGSTGSASLYGDSEVVIIENYYLFVAHETGWLGLGLFLSLFGLILQRLWNQRRDWLALALFGSGVGLGLIGLLLPVWVDDTVSIIWWGLAAVALATGGKGLTRVRKQANQKATRTT